MAKPGLGERRRGLCRAAYPDLSREHLDAAFGSRDSRLYGPGVVLVDTPYNYRALQGETGAVNP